jgi:hypothetical protein
MKGLLIFLLIFVIYMLFFRSSCSMCNETMENTMYASNNSIPSVNNDFSSIDEVFPNPPKSNRNQRIDLEKLPECKMPMKIEFSSNINNMMNNGNQIYQDIIKPSGQRSMIGSDNFNLKQISWTKSKLNWYDEELPLEIRLTNINNETGKLTHIIFPVKLVDEKLIEKFDNSFFGLDGGRLIENFDINSFFNKATSVFTETKIPENIKLNKVVDVTQDILSSNLATQTFLNRGINLTKITDVAQRILKKDVDLAKIVDTTQTIIPKDINLIKITDMAQNILQSNAIAKKIINQDDFNKIISSSTELAKTKGIDVEKIIESKIGQKLKDEAYKIVNEVSKIDPEIKNKIELNKPEIVTKVIEIKDKLSEVTLNKLDLANVVNKVDTKDLDKLKEKLNKINFDVVAKNFNNQQFTTYDINSLLNLNLLIKDKSTVPTYKCCTPNYGKIISIDLCQTAQKVLDQEKFFFATGNDNSLVLITKPQPYNKTIGEQIIKNLGEPSDLF